MFFPSFSQAAAKELKEAVEYGPHDFVGPRINRVSGAADYISPPQIDESGSETLSAQTPLYNLYMQQETEAENEMKKDHLEQEQLPAARIIQLLASPNPLNVR